MLGPSPSVAERPSTASFRNDGPNRHRLVNNCWENGFRHVFTHTHLMSNGKHEFLFHSPFGRWDPPPDSAGQHIPMHTDYSDLGKLPCVNFPSFDGENYKLWQKRCIDFFDMYDVHPSVWIKVSTMHFTGAAARWLQSVEHKLPQLSWSEFGTMIKERFGKDQHALLVRQLFHIRQVGSVAEYVDQFAQLVDQLNSYQEMKDPLYYTTWFLDGLRHDIKSTVMIQRPKDLDTAFVLAQL